MNDSISKTTPYVGHMYHPRTLQAYQKGSSYGPPGGLHGT